MSATLHADRGELARFVDALFRYADEGTYVSLRAFNQFDRGRPPELIRAFKINGDLGPLIDLATEAATECASADQSIVFAPPICKFNNPNQARGMDLANGLGLSVDLDGGDTQAARRKLEFLLGPATVIVASGGAWTDPKSGEIHEKLHMHWRISEPTREPDDHEKLRRARELVAQLVGADPTGKPVQHPYRWAGSWNTKDKPRMARSVAYNNDAEIDLAEALEILEQAASAAGRKAAGISGSADQQAEPALLDSAMQAIPNSGTDVHYADWIRLGYARHRAYGGEDGFDAWETWSKLSDKYDATETEAAWKRITAAIEDSHVSRPISAGTIFWKAKKHGWSRPEPETGEKTEAKRSRVNLLSLVRHIKSTPAWDGALRFNLLSECYEICGSFPPHDGPKEKPRPLEDPRDILCATMYFQANGFPKALKSTATDAIAAVAHEHSYHPVRDYLNRLQWDGEERVSKLFQQYYNADMPTDSGERDRHVAYLEHISVGFMVGAVARVMNPGCKHDHVPVVVSREQGLLKSTSILALCADPAWFSDNLPPDLADRGTKESLRGKWIIELSEIPHVRREVERLKAFISDAADRYRAPYGRVNQDHPRQCVFIGTSNDLEFADVTGNRRFWPFRISSAVDVEAILRDRDQLWAEAADLYRRGIKWWLPPNIEKIAAERQEAFVEADLWDGLITTWLTKHPGPFTMEDLFARDTGIMPLRDTAMTPRADEMRAARCLVRLGWHKNRCTLNGERAVWWQRKPGSGQWA